VIVEFSDTHGDRFGVEPMCRVLGEHGCKVAPSTYYAAKCRPPSARACRDTVMIPILLALWVANYRVYGAHKLWKAARRAGHDIGRDQVAGLMRAAGMVGVSRRRRLRTTRPDDTTPRHPDPVGRDFAATAPNRLWVTDLCVAEWHLGGVAKAVGLDGFDASVTRQERSRERDRAGRGPTGRERWLRSSTARPSLARLTGTRTVRSGSPSEPPHLRIRVGVVTSPPSRHSRRWACRRITSTAYWMLSVSTTSIVPSSHRTRNVLPAASLERG
jgi:hypothetical protein